jgi:hypothetical protein
VTPLEAGLLEQRILFLLTAQVTIACLDLAVLLLASLSVAALLVQLEALVGRLAPRGTVRGPWPRRRPRRRPISRRHAE